MWCLAAMLGLISQVFQQLCSTLMDMPFDGFRLFGAKADLDLERFKDIKATAPYLGLAQSASTAALFS